MNGSPMGDPMVRVDRRRSVPHIDPYFVGPMMYAAVVKSVRAKRLRTYADGKCSEDFHVSFAEEEYCDMQLVIKQCVKLHDSNVKLVICNSLTKVLP
jgi:hypothetical protein